MMFTISHKKDQRLVVASFKCHTKEEATIIANAYINANSLDKEAFNMKVSDSIEHPLWGRAYKIYFTENADRKTASNLVCYFACYNQTSASAFRTAFYEAIGTKYKLVDFPMEEARMF